MKVIWDRYNPQTRRNQKTLHRARFKQGFIRERMR
jgi:hypothetical protein